MKPNAETANRLADAACVSLRTAHKAMALGADALRPLTSKRVLEAAKRLGIVLPGSAPSTPPPAAP